jgi:hypothetical protein
MKKLNEIYIERLLSNKHNISKSLKEGVDLVNFLLELMKLDIYSKRYWKILKKIFIKFSHENRLNIFEQIFGLCVFSLNSVGNKNFYITLDESQQPIIRKSKLGKELIVAIPTATSTYSYSITW